jgi:hypothetical protein
VQLKRQLSPRALEAKVSLVAEKLPSQKAQALLPIHCMVFLLCKLSLEELVWEAQTVGWSSAAMAVQ